MIALVAYRMSVHRELLKLLDYRDRTADLETSTNPFALVVLAHLAAIATRRDPAARLEHKIGLTRRLYRQGLERDDILSLYAFIDWVLALPDALEEDYHRCIQAIEEAEHMQYVTTAERIGIQKGRQEGRQEGEAAMLLRQIARKFGPPTETVRERIERADPETLVEWPDRILTAQTLDEVLH